MSDLVERKKVLTSELKKKKRVMEDLEAKVVKMKMEQEIDAYTDERKELSEFIREWISVFNDGEVYGSKSLETEGFSYHFSEWVGEVRLRIKSKEGLSRRKFLKDWFTPELEIKITRDFANDRGQKYVGNGTAQKHYHWITDHLDKWEDREENYGHKILPIMEIKTFTDLDYADNKWIRVGDNKLTHYLTILRDDLKNHLDMKIVELRKNGVE